jgi:superfamily II DNA or RNA helicase
MKVLRPYQEAAVSHLWEAFGNKEKIVLAAPTGAGKTALAARIFVQAREQKLRVAFCVPFLSLIDQTYEAFSSEGIPEREMSLVQADNPLQDYSKPVQICSVDTLVRRKNLPEVDIVIFDEAHRQSKLYKRWMDECPNVKFAGLSATPWARGMADVWDRLIIVSTTRELIDQKYLCDYKYYAPSSPDLSGVSIVAGDYHEGELGTAMNKPELVADIINTWKEKAENRPTLAFCVNREHAREVQYQFLQAGIQCGYVDAYTSVSDRKDLINQLKKGDLKVIVNIGTMTTGVDAPFLSCIIMARPTKSEMLFLQIIGRGLRTHQTKQHLLILDHSDTGLNLGLPCTIHHTSLRTGKVSKEAKAADKEAAKEKSNKPHKCVSCNHLHDRMLMVCPSCGHIRKRISDVIMREGYLTELSRDGSQKAIIGVDRAIRQDWYSGLLYICMERGYAQGWAAHKWKEKFGGFPDNYNKIAKPPSNAVRSWVRSRQIAYAKAKQKQTAQGITF